MEIGILAKKIYDRIYVHLWEYRKYSTYFKCLILKKEIKEKNIWLLGIPRSTNLGDHAQVLCSERWFRINYPEFAIHEFNSFELMQHNKYLLEFISKHAQKDDLVFFQSGYNFTDMYPSQEIMHREAVRMMPHNKFVFLPQTIKFKKPYETNEFVKESRELYEGKENIYLLCRDEKSLEIARDSLKDVKKRAFPDIVTTMIGSTTLPRIDRTNVMLCIRHDKESSLTKDEVIDLSNKLRRFGGEMITDTTLMLSSPNLVRNHREKYISKMLKEIRSCKVVVTDRYHGLVFSMIANTPVVLLKTIDHKITEGIKWFPDYMAKHIRVADSVGAAVAFVEELTQEPEYELDAYFQNKYYDKLLTLLNHDESWEK